MPSAVVVLPAGAEEMEFVASVDVLRRAGVTVTVGGLDGTDPVKCSRDVVIVPDVALSSIDKDSFDVIVLPGGLGGAKAMAASSLIGDLLRNQEKNGKLIAAICASPAMVLKAHEIGVGKKITCYPSFKDQLDDKFTFVDEIVVQDGKLITSQGPATAFAFGVKIAENLVGAEKANQVANGILLK
ncbi:CLUMA_CG010349, isoform A [Clunio marinus]|uniref:CLUMA_CG010349, isoform A n=1 Tax=Clunio marinus TaxID=568069 RepID=A0A1J1IBU2_9DIPT|nr:CLUMA_CG010349, isoform A [Clunio marinus]